MQVSALIYTMGRKAEHVLQVSALIYTMGRKAEHVYKSFTLADRDDTKFDVILAKFDEHFVSKGNTIHERARFHQRRNSRKAKARRDSRIVRTKSLRINRTLRFWGQ